MAQQDLRVDWTINVAQALTAARQLKTELLAVEVISDRLKPKLVNAFSGVATPMGAASRSAGALAKNLNNVGTAGDKAALSLSGVASSAGAMGGHFQASTGHTNNLLAGFARFAGFHALLAGMVKMAGAFGEALKHAREHMEAMADQSLDKRDKSRQLASLMGEKEGPNDRVMSRVYGVGMASGMSFDESLGFLQEFEGSIPAGVQKGNVKEEDKKDIAIAVAQSAIRLGLNPKTAGDLIGTIGANVNLNTKVDTKTGKKMTPAQAAASEIEATIAGLNTGRGDVTTLANNEIATAAKVMTAGRLPHRSDIGAIVGTASVAGAKSGNSAGTFAGWWDRALNRTGEPGKWLEKSGIAAGKDDLEKADLFRDVIAKAEAEHKGPNKFDPNTFLAQQGFGSDQDRLALLGMNAMNQPGAKGEPSFLHAQIDKGRAIAGDASVAAKANAEFQGSKAMRMRMAKARMEFAEFTQGAKGEDLQIARMDAAAALEQRGVLNRADTKIGEAFAGGFGAKEYVGLAPEQQKTIDAEVRARLEEKVKNAGLDPAKAHLRYSEYAPNPGQLKIQQTMDALRAMGVDPHSGASDALGSVEASAGDRSPEARARWEAAKGMQPGAGKGGAPQRPPAKGVGDDAAALRDAAGALHGAAKAQMAAAREQANPFATLPDMGQNGFSSVRF